MEHFQLTIFWSKCDVQWKPKHVKSRAGYLRVPRGDKDTQIKTLNIFIPKAEETFYHNRASLKCLKSFGCNPTWIKNKIQKLGSCHDTELSFSSLPDFAKAGKGGGGESCCCFLKSILKMDWCHRRKIQNSNVTKFSDARAYVCNLGC